MNTNVISAFTQLSQSDFGTTYLEQINRVDHISIGFWESVNYGWVKDTMAVRWYQTENGLQMDFDDYGQLNDHLELKELLTSPDTTPNKLREALLGLGYKDVTEVSS